MKKILLLILILPVIVQAQDTEVQDMPALTDIAGTDVFYVVDDPTGTPASKKITATDIFDIIKTFALLDAIVADKDLANLDDAMTWVALGTFNLGITITTGDPFTLGAIRWDDGSDQIDGEQIADDTIDNDSIDWEDMTDLTTDGALDADVVDEAHIADDGIDSEHYNNGSIDLVHLAAGVYAKDLVTTAPITGAADNIFVGADADVTVALTMLKDIVTTAPITGGEDDVLPGGDADLTIAITLAKDLVTTAPVTGGTDNILPGADSDVTVALDFTAAWNFNGNVSIGNAATTAGVLTLLEDDDDGANFASFMVPALTANTVYTLPPDDGDNTEVLQTDGGGTLTWVANAGGGTMSSFFAEDGDTTEVEIDDAKEWKFVEGASIDIDWTDTSDGSDADPYDLTVKLVVADDESTDDDHEIVFTTDNATLESDGDFHYSPDTGTVTATEFVGGGSGLTLASTDLSDTADLLYETELDDLLELTGQIGDVTAFITDDDMPAVGTDPDVDAAGEIGRDTDGADETGDSSLRGYDGAAQFLYSKKIKHIIFSIVNPDQIEVWTGRVNPSQPVWFNTTGMTFTITEVYAISDTDNYDFTLFESASATDMSDDNDASIIAIQCDADGTECFTDTEAAIGHAVEADHAIIFEDTLGSAKGVLVTISGWFNSDVD